MTVYGHGRVRRALEDQLPPAALITGPPSIGKRTLVRHLLEHHQVKVYDQFSALTGTNMDIVRAARVFATGTPFGAQRVICLNLQGSSVQAQNALLKILEEPPPTTRFLLTAAHGVLPTVSSRCNWHRLGLLSQMEVTAVLVHLGIPHARAAKAAAFSGGQVRPAVEADQRSSEQRNNVVACMKALSLGDIEGFHRAFTTWDALAGELLSTWFTETITQRWQIFTEQDAFGLHHDRDRLIRMLSAFAGVSRASPRLQARAALEPFVGK